MTRLGVPDWPGALLRSADDVGTARDGGAGTGRAEIGNPPVNGSAEAPPPDLVPEVVPAAPPARGERPICTGPDGGPVGTG